MLDRATELGRVLVIQDDDLLREGQLRQLAGRSFSGVIYAHQRMPVGHCIEFLELISAAGEPEEFADCVYYLPPPAQR